MRIQPNPYAITKGCAEDLLLARGDIRALMTQRDYFDAAPTRGVFKGVADTKLIVKVAVIQAQQDGQS